ncbi:MAG TPA: glycosyltransferase family 4 protein [Pyrinomonadaceae bacterium]
MSKRVILFGPLPPPYGGVSVLLTTLLGHLKNSSILVWVLFGTDSSDSRITRFNHRRLGVVKALARQGYKSRIVDFTHFHLEYPNSILLPIWLFAKSVLRFEWIKYILDGSLPQRYASFTTAKKRRFQNAIASIDEFIVVSEKLRDWLINEVRVTKPITVIPCLMNIPAELLETKLSPTTQTVFDRFLQHEKRICSIGTFIPSYGFEHVAEAVEQLRNVTKEDIGLLLLNGSFAEDLTYRERVLKGRDWITVLTNIPNPDIYQIMPRCHLFVRAAEAEGYGISRVEAIWCGTPVIAVDVGETRGMLTYKFGDVEMLSQLIGEVLSGRNKPELTSWANLFHAEADENLRRFVETVQIENPAEVLDSVEVRA